MLKYGRTGIMILYFDRRSRAALSKFFQNNPNGTFSKVTDVEVTNEEIISQNPGVQVVILTGIGGNGGDEYYKIGNYWGWKWGNEGGFRVRVNSDLKILAFYDVFWYLEDLSQTEKDSWNNLTKDEQQNFLSKFKFSDN